MIRLFTKCSSNCIVVVIKLVYTIVLNSRNSNILTFLKMSKKFFFFFFPTIEPKSIEKELTTGKNRSISFL